MDVLYSLQVYFLILISLFSGISIFSAYAASHLAMEISLFLVLPFSWKISTLESNEESTGADPGFHWGGGVAPPPPSIDSYMTRIAVYVLDQCPWSNILSGRPPPPPTHAWIRLQSIPIMDIDS